MHISLELKVNIMAEMTREQQEKVDKHGKSGIKASCRKI